MIVYFAGTRYHGRPGTDRHLADALGRLAPVLFVEQPVSPLTRFVHAHLAEARRTPELGRESERLWRLTPRVLPGAHRSGMHHVTAALMRRKARRAAAAIGERVDGVVVTVPGDLLGTVPGARTVYFATDDLVAGAELLGLPRRRLEAAEADHLARADAVAAVSPALCERFRTRGRDAAFIPNGCAPDAYTGVDEAPWPDDVPRFDRPAAGFVGHVNARIDLGLLEAVADAGHPLLIVGALAGGAKGGGDRARFAALTARPGVTWVGAKPFGELPGYLRAISVGLTPYAAGGFNEASFPLKTLEYLAAGRGAVATPLPATAWLRADGDGADLIRSEASPDAFAKAVGEELAARPSPGLAARRRAFARRHGWDGRARALADLLDLPVPPDLAGPPVTPARSEGDAR